MTCRLVGGRWFNRYIVECKSANRGLVSIPILWFNRYIVECKLAVRVSRVASAVAI